MFHKIIMILLLVLSICALLSLLYIITARHFEDRLVGTNLVGTIVINLIAVLAIYFESGFVVDICLVFAFLSFLAIVVLCRLLAIQRIEQQLEEAKKAQNKDQGGTQQ